MTHPRTIHLLGNTIDARRKALAAVMDAPEGWVVDVRPPKAARIVETNGQIDMFADQEARPVIAEDPAVPACWEGSDTDWQGYIREAKASDWDSRRFCRDCSPARRNAMIAANRCAYPETVFVSLRGEGMVGLRRDDPGWFGAITGKYQGSGKLAATQAIAPASLAAFEQREKGDA